MECLNRFHLISLAKVRKKMHICKKKIKYFILRDYFTTIETTCGAIVRRSRSFERKWDKNFLPRSRYIIYLQQHKRTAKQIVRAIGEIRTQSNNIPFATYGEADRSNECEIRTQLALEGEITPTDCTDEHIFVAPCPLGRNLIKSFGANIRPLSSVLRNKLPPALRSRSRLNLN